MSRQIRVERSGRTCGAEGSVGPGFAAGPSGPVEAQHALQPATAAAGGGPTGAGGRRGTAGGGGDGSAAAAGEERRPTTRGGGRGDGCGGDGGATTSEGHFNCWLVGWMVKVFWRVLAVFWLEMDVRGGWRSARDGPFLYCRTKVTSMLAPMSGPNTQPHHADVKCVAA